jgi:hypothetical protein
MRLPPKARDVRGHAAIALGLLLLFSLPVATANSIPPNCYRIDPGARIILWTAENGTMTFGSPRVTLANNTSVDPPVFACMLPAEPAPRVIPEPPPPLAIMSAYTFWTGPGAVGVSWVTNVASTGRVAWGLDDGRYIAYEDFSAAQASHGVRIPLAPSDRPLHITIQAMSAAGEIVQLDLQGPPPSEAPATAPSAAPNWPAALFTSLAAIGAVVLLRKGLAGRK